MSSETLVPYMRRELDAYSKKLASTGEALGAAALYVAIVRDQEQTTDGKVAQHLIHELHLAQLDLTAAINRISDLTAHLDESTRN